MIAQLPLDCRRTLKLSVEISRLPDTVCSAPLKTPHPLFQQPNGARALAEQIERLIETSGLEWTFLRLGMFAANAPFWWAPLQSRKGPPIVRRTSLTARPNLAQYKTLSERYWREHSTRRTLSAAQLFLGRAHGFASWPKFAAHFKAAARSDSNVPCEEKTGHTTFPNFPDPSRIPNAANYGLPFCDLSVRP